MGVNTTIKVVNVSYDTHRILAMLNLFHLRKILFSFVFILVVTLGIKNQIKPIYSVDQIAVLLERQRQGKIRAYFKLLLSSMSQFTSEYQELF
jgi:hypothetical protein